MSTRRKNRGGGKETKKAFNILGLDTSESITMEKLNKAYRAKSLKVHPDRNKSKNAQKDFVELTDAKEFLERKLSRNGNYTLSPDTPRRDTFRYQSSSGTERRARSRSRERAQEEASRARAWARAQEERERQEEASRARAWARAQEERERQEEASRARERARQERARQERPYQGNRRHPMQTAMREERDWQNYNFKRGEENRRNDEYINKNISDDVFGRVERLARQLEVETGRGRARSRSESPEYDWSQSDLMPKRR